MYEVYLMDDSFNMREFVSRVLMMVCDMSEPEAERIMMQANWEYQALVGSWEEPVAQHIYDSLKRHGLSTAIQPQAEDDAPARE